MLLFFHAKLAQSKLSAREFFETAYIWRFGKLNNLTADHLDWVINQRLPPYVVEFLKYLQE